MKDRRKLVTRWAGTFAGIYLIAIILIAKPVSLLKVSTGSMEPALEVGSTCVVFRWDEFESVDVGDIVVFSMFDGSLVAHRVTEKSPVGLVTKGDANETADIFTVTADNFYGKVIFCF